MDVGEKMRLKHIKGSEEIVENSKIVIKSPELYKGKWKNVFKNNNKIYIEIGMGKGSFLIENARKHRNINYIGVEKYPSVLLNAIKTIEEENLTNIKIICVDANNIDNIFDKEETKTPDMEDDMDNILLLSDEDGNDVQFEFLDLIDYDEEEYVVLLQVED